MMNSVKHALDNLNKRMTDRSPRPPLSYDLFLRQLTEQPTLVLRNIFQIFHDMVSYYMGAGIDEYPDDPESIHYVNYDCSRLFEEDSDRPYFADRLFANRLVNIVENIKRGSQQNKIYIFNGPPGCGKSTFLNTLLKKFETYANTDDGMRYEILWRIDTSLFSGSGKQPSIPILEQLAALIDAGQDESSGHSAEHFVAADQNGVLEIPCPSHDHPILIIPKDYRDQFLDDLFGGSSFRKMLRFNREYHWVFRDKPCTFCGSLYRGLLNVLKKPELVHKMVYARPYRFNRRLGDGITVFNPGDPPTKHAVLRNPAVQARLNALLKTPAEVQYVYSRYAKTNNGVYALMDVKSHNTARLIELHNIISEGVHKVGDVEENVNSLLLAVMNPEDQRNVNDFKSFSDRIEYINIPYVMDVGTEIKIYRNTFGKQINDKFLPRVLHNFGRVIISTRMNTRSEALLEWIGDPKKYSLYCDEKLQLLKMEIYAGVIPPWLTEEDRRNLTARRRRKIIAESEGEGVSGVSGRDSIKVFNEFYSAYAKQDKLITMSMLYDFFTRRDRDLMRLIPKGFLDSLTRMYNYTVLQEVKESLYYYNERQISHDIKNYLFAINFEPPTEAVCTYTNEKIQITENFFKSIENRLLGAGADSERRRAFREATQREYTSKALTQEILVGDKSVAQTDIYKDLRDRYVRGLKEKALDPFLDNDNFRRAIKDYGTRDFRTYDKRIRDDVRYVMRNLQRKFGYTDRGAKEVCMYVIDNDLARKFDV
jgi:predicted Ser/Thr protein kinase